MVIQLMENRLLQLFRRLVGVQNKVDRAVVESPLHVAVDPVAFRLMEDFSREIPKRLHRSKLDSLHPAFEVAQRVPNRVICIPFGEGRGTHIVVVPGSTGD